MDNPSIVSHISLGTNEFDRAVAFYDAVLATIGAKRLIEHPDTVAYGRVYPEFWIGVPLDDEPASVGNGTHVSFWASSQEEVRAFHAAGVAHGASDDGAPGPRPEYGAPYYGCFLRDLDGHKIEATFWDQSMEED
ncbi:MAG: VOC family protein [Pseudomonadota bacterium]